VSDFVRVKHPIFGHFSTRKPDLWGGEVTDDPAVDANDKPLPAKPKVSVAKKAAEKKSNTPTNGAESATTPKEGS
jgi:hypothetical protein